MTDWNNPQDCLVALRKDGTDLAYISNQTEEMCIVAVEQNVEALRHVNEPTELLCIKALLLSPAIALRHIPDHLLIRIMTRLSPKIKELYNL